jgi:vitamin B12 transporter
LILKLNKHFACGFVYYVKVLSVFCLFISNRNYGQDTVSLNNVEVSSKKIRLSQIGKKTEMVDSTLKEQFKFNSVGDVLGYNSSVFIKSYGPGALATIAFRGGNASQTAVLWNGFNLQNAMLGQADLALMPSVLFENIGIEYGGSSSLWGSGAIGGSIHLNNNTAFGQGLFTSVNVGGGSFGLLNASANVLVSKQRFISSTKVYLNSSENNFKYKDTLDKENPNKRQKNGEYNFKGLMQEFKFIINPKQILSVNAWINSNHRHLPAYGSSNESKAYQDDNAIRLTANWSYVKNNFKSVLKGGYFEDGINYTDSISAVFSKSKTRTFMAENENYFSWHKNNQLNVAFNALSSSATVESYSSQKTLSRASVLAGNKFSFFGDQLISYVSVRAEYFSVGTLPVTGNASLEYKLFRNVTAKLNVARVYRQPTLNELYWIPGGNINLKPEQGYTYEGELNYKRQFKNISFFVSAAAYSRKINNWILWIPGSNGNSTPVNIQQVWSRGTETTWKVNYKKNKFRAGIGLISAYILSTVQENGQENDNTVNKQLIYTPRYTINGHISIGYDQADLVFFHQYNGYRFTTSDNLSWLDPYQVSSLRFNYRLEFKSIKFILFAACNNLFNTNYTILAGRPMPLRYYEFGISLQTKQINKITNN